MYGDQPIWWDPIIHSKSRSKSYVAYVPQPGLNYTHFLNLPPLPSTQRRCTLGLEVPEELVVRLPDVLQIGQERRLDTVDIIADPTLDLPEPATHNPNTPQGRSQIGPEIVDSKGNRYRADKSTGDILPLTTTTPMPKPTLIMGEAERRPLSKRWEGETLEDQFRDMCEIAPEFQDAAYRQLYDAGCLEAEMEKANNEVIGVYIFREEIPRQKKERQEAILSVCGSGG